MNTRGPAPRALIAAALAAVALAACGADHAVSPGSMRAFEVSLAVDGDRAALAWYGGGADVDAIYLQDLDRSGRAKGAPRRVSDPGRRGLEPDLQFLDGAPVMAWYEKQPSQKTSTAWLERLDAKGGKAWRRRLDGAGGAARNAVARVAGNVIDVAWIETPPAPQAEPAIWAARFDGQGRALTPPRKVGRAGRTTWNLNAAVDARGVFYVVYDARLETRANELHLLVVDDAGSRSLRLGADDGAASVYPDLSINAAGVAALTWFDQRDGNEEVYLSVAPLDRLLSEPRPARRVSYTLAPSTGAYLAWNAQTLALVWCDAQPGQNDLYARLFGADGRPITPTRRLTETPAQSSIPSVRPAGRDFLVAWNEYQSTGEGGHGGVASSVAMTTRLAVDP